jgi:hypothetical protein
MSAPRQPWSLTAWLTKLFPERRKHRSTRKRHGDGSEAPHAPNETPGTEDPEESNDDGGRSLAAFSRALLANARDTAFIVAIFLYFAGFMYRYLYRQVWGITSSDGDPQFYGYLVFAVPTLQQGWHWILLIAASAVALVLLVDFLAQWWEQILLLRPLVVSAGIVLLFVTLTTQAQLAAVNSFNQIRRGELPGARIKFFSDAKARAAYGANFMQDNENGVLSVVEETKDAYYVLDQPGISASILPNGSEATLPDGALVLVPKKEVDYIKSDLVGVPNLVH